MSERGLTFEAEAGIVTYMLLGSAFYELVAAVRGADPKRGNALLLELQEGVVSTLERL
jgi:hypothetical protein